MRRTSLSRKCQNPMNKIRLTAFAAAFLSAVGLTHAQDSNKNDFGLDFTLATEKRVCKGLGLEVEANLRTQDDSNALERWGIGADLGWKVYNSKKFDLKLSAGWIFMRQQKLGTEELECVEKVIPTPEGPMKIKEYDLKETSSFWRSRHRTNLGISASYSPDKRWTLTLREIVQYNHYNSASHTVTKWQWRDDEPREIDSQKEKTSRAKDRFILRSRLGVQYNIRHSAFEPFANAEYGRGLNYNVNKWRASIGTDYSFNKHNKMTVFYRFQHEDDDDEPNGHLVGFGFKHIF